jgi:hypothetical protein
MSVTIDYTQVRTVEEGPRYKVQTTVSLVSGIASQIFVMNTELGTYEHVATVWDMENVVPDRDRAILELRNFYRASSCEVDYETEMAAIEFTTYTEDRIRALATAYDRYVRDFEGTVNYHVENMP